MYMAVKHICYFPEGREFHVLTEHKLLTYALQARPDSPRQFRHLDYIAQFTSTIRHVNGHDNAVADALSLAETNALLMEQPPVINFTDMAKAQTIDPHVRALQSSPSTSLEVEEVSLNDSETTILCNMSTATAHPLVPHPWRRLILITSMG